MKYKVVTNLTGVKRDGKHGKFDWKEEIIYMKWGKEEEEKERKAEGLLHISEYLGDIMMLSSNKERSPRKEKKKSKKPK